MKISYRITHSPESAVLRYGCPRGYEKRREELYCDMKECLEKYGLYYEEYLLYNCAGQDEEYKASFISEIGRMELYSKYNDKRDEKMFHDKFKVYEKYKPYFCRNAVSVSSRRDEKAFLEFASQNETFFVKPVDKSCGYGVELIKMSDHSSAKVLFKSLCRGGRKLCEQIILQHEETRIFNPTSLNTVRIVTFTESDGSVKLHSAFFRMGRYGQNVDNAGSGGIFVVLDPATGLLNPVGRDENGRYYNAHPDSRISFRGVVLPNWAQAKALAEKLAKVTPTSRLIGWDLAATQNGWCMVEANYRGQFICQQAGGLSPQAIRGYAVG